MLESILVPLDGSPLAEKILVQLRPLLRRQDSKVILVRAVFAPPPLAEPEHLVRSQEDRVEAKTYIDGMTQRLLKAGVQARGVVADGAPEAVILDVAAREQATLIAMTTHGRSGLGRWVFGSVAEKVIRASGLPLLLVKSFKSGSQKGVDAKQIPFRKLLVTTDGSDLSLAAVPGATEVAQLYDSEIVVLHVEAGPSAPAGAFTGTLVDPVAGPLVPVFPDVPREMIESVAGKFAAQGLRTRTMTVRGDAASQIVDLSRSNGFDLIVMATHGRSGITRWALGSVTEKVLRAAEVPMLVVRVSQPA